MIRQRDVVIRQLTDWQLPMIAWHRLRGRRIGLMEAGIASSVTRSLARASGVTSVDLGSVVCREPMSSLWTDMDTVVTAVLRYAGDVTAAFPDDVQPSDTRVEKPLFGPCKVMHNEIPDESEPSPCLSR